MKVWQALKVTVLGVLALGGIIALLWAVSVTVNGPVGG